MESYQSLCVLLSKLYPNVTRRGPLSINIYCATTVKTCVIVFQSLYTKTFKKGLSSNHLSFLMSLMSNFVPGNAGDLFCIRLIEFNYNRLTSDL